MSASALHVERRTEQLLTVESLAAVGVSLVCHVVRRLGRDGRELAVGEARPSFWCAYYGPKILANGWEPFDQPGPAAYMPCRYADFAMITLNGGGAVLVQREIMRSRAVLRRSHPGVSGTFIDVSSSEGVASTISSLLERFAISHGETLTVTGRVLAVCEELLDRVAAA